MVEEEEEMSAIFDMEKDVTNEEKIWHLEVKLLTLSCGQYQVFEIHYIVLRLVGWNASF